MKPERYFKDHQDDIFYVRATTNKHNHKPGFQLHNQQLSTPTHFLNVSDEYSTGRRKWIGCPPVSKRARGRKEERKREAGKVGGYSDALHFILFSF